MPTRPQLATAAAALLALCLLAPSRALAKAAPESKCLQPVKVGRCKAFMPRWHYDENTQLCHRFMYSGCGKNGNNFANKRVCQANCMPELRCKEAVDPGPCRGFFPAFFFDAEARECRGFVFGGCKGNGNRFDTLAECQLACGQKA